MLGLRANQDNEVRCPFCHALAGEVDRLWPCPRCGTVHHEDCARENGQCTILGCCEAVSGRAAGLPPVERSLRAAARGRQDLLVLGVSLTSVAALYLAERTGAGGGELRVGPILLTFVAVAGIAATFRWLRRRNRIGG
jgi:hypothetical protein